MTDPILGVVFDLDGTLLDSLNEIATPANTTLEKAGYPTHPVAAYKQFVGDGARMVLTRALPEAVRADESIVEPLVADFLLGYQEVSGKIARPYDGIAEMLDGLLARGIRLFILSNKPHPFTLSCVESQLSAWDFEIIFGARETVPKKPDPAGAIEIAELARIPAGRFLYLGDTPVDMETARSAGMVAVAAEWGFRSKEELLAAGADHVITHPTELLNLL